MKNNISRLFISPERWVEKEDWQTGIFIRAQLPNETKWYTADIAILEKDSLLVWLRSRGGNNPYAEDVVGILLGHGHLHQYEEHE